MRHGRLTSVNPAAVDVRISWWWPDRSHLQASLSAFPACWCFLPSWLFSSPSTCSPRTVSTSDHQVSTPLDRETNRIVMLLSLIVCYRWCNISRPVGGQALITLWLIRRGPYIQSAGSGRVMYMNSLLCPKATLCKLCAPALPIYSQKRLRVGTNAAQSTFLYAIGCPLQPYSYTAGPPAARSRCQHRSNNSIYQATQKRKKGKGEKIHLE